MTTVIRCGKTIHCIGIPEANQVFENILSDLSVIKIYQFANKVRSGIAIPGNPFHIQMNTVFIAYFKHLSTILAVAWLSARFIIHGFLSFENGTLNFRKFKVALNPMYRIFLNFAKSCV